MDAGSSSSQMHIVIFPWLGFGHLLPFLDLADRLATRGHLISFLSTPRNLARLPPAAMAPLIEFVPLPLPAVDGLPAGAESTTDVPHDKSDLHRLAFDGLAVPFSNFLAAAAAAESKKKKKKPDWIITDTFHHWVSPIAKQHSIPCAMLVLCSASWFAGHAVSKFRPPPTRFIDMESPETEKKKTLSISERLFVTAERCDLMVIRSCLELEPEDLPLVSTRYGKPVVPLGLLPPPAKRDGDAGVEEHAGILSWLDEQPARSVVYVALGSEAPVTVEQVKELALGLELAGVRFLWALRRKPHDVGVVLPPPEDDQALDDDVLPLGFRDRTRGHGLVVTGWVPQTTVLGHGAVGGFLTHCGWSSTIEGLMFGRPVVMLPIVFDQAANARLMERREVGVLVPRLAGEEYGAFDRHGVAAAVRDVMVDNGGVFTDNAKKLQEFVADRECHERYIDGFIEKLRSYKGA